MVKRVSHRQACKCVGLNRGNYFYQTKRKNDEDVIAELALLTQKHVSIGFWQCYHRLRRKGFTWNHKKVYRIYTAMKLNIRRRAKKRLPARVKNPLSVPVGINQIWSIDFMSDSLWDGRKFRLLNIVDDYNREMLAMEVDTSLPASRVIKALDVLKEFRGLPLKIRMDNGPEFISHKLDEWAKENGVELLFIQPGEPTQNAYIERCNGSIRRELLNAYIFNSLNEVREKSEEWMMDYNYHRPHQALNFKSPADFLQEV
jgi:putative transposase